eukprot:scaffold29516_cov52-Attheya_sp.AAC.3
MAGKIETGMSCRLLLRNYCYDLSSWAFSIHTRCPSMLITKGKRNDNDYDNSTHYSGANKDTFLLTMR